MKTPLSSGIFAILLLAWFFASHATADLSFSTGPPAPDSSGLSQFVITAAPFQLDYEIDVQVTFFLPNSWTEPLPYINSIRRSDYSGLGGLMDARPALVEGVWPLTIIRTLSATFQLSMPVHSSPFSLVFLYDSPMVIPMRVSYGIRDDPIGPEVQFFYSTNRQIAQFSPHVAYLAPGSTSDLNQYQFTIDNLSPFAQDSLFIMFAFRVRRESAAGLLDWPDQITFDALGFGNDSPSAGKLILHPTAIINLTEAAYMLQTALPVGTTAIRFNIELGIVNAILEFSPAMNIPNDLGSFDLFSDTLGSYRLRTRFNSELVMPRLIWEEASASPSPQTLTFYIRQIPSSLAQQTAKFAIIPRPEARNVHVYACSSTQATVTQDYFGNGVSGTIKFLDTIPASGAISIECKVLRMIGSEQIDVTAYGFHTHFAAGAPQNVFITSPSWLETKSPPAVSYSTVAPPTAVKSFPICYGWCDGTLRTRLIVDIRDSTVVWVDPVDLSLLSISPRPLLDNFDLGSIFEPRVFGITRRNASGNTGSTENSLDGMHISNTSHGKSILVLNERVDSPNRVAFPALPALTKSVEYGYLDLQLAIDMITPLASVPSQANEFTWSLGPTADSKQINWQVNHRRNSVFAPINPSFDKFSPLSALPAPDIRLVTFDGKNNYDISSSPNLKVQFSIVFEPGEFLASSSPTQPDPAQLWTQDTTPLLIAGSRMEVTWAGTWSGTDVTMSDLQLDCEWTGEVTQNLRNKFVIPNTNPIGATSQSQSRTCATFSFTFPQLATSDDPFVTFTPLISIGLQPMNHFGWGPTGETGLELFRLQRPNNQISLWRPLVASDYGTVKLQFETLSGTLFTWTSGAQSGPPFGVFDEISAISISFESTLANPALEIDICGSASRIPSGCPEKVFSDIQTDTQGRFDPLWSRSNFPFPHQMTGFVSIRHTVALKDIQKEVVVLSPPFPAGSRPGPALKLDDVARTIIRFSNSIDTPNPTVSPPATIVLSSSTSVLYLGFANTLFDPNLPANTVESFTINVFARIPGSAQQTPIKLSSSTIQPTAEALVILPQGFTSGDIFVVVLQKLQGGTQITYTSLESFTVVPDCFQLPFDINDVNDPDALTDLCGLNSQCTATGCQCEHGWTGPSCNVQTKPCDHCPSSNFLTCSDTNQCECTPNWFGPTCETPKDCHQESLRRCKNNGTLMHNGSCGSTCQCPNHWAGSSCQQCPLTCGTGRANPNCSKCGCPAGKSGAMCECSSLIARLTINGFNNYVVNHHSLLENGASPSSSEFTFVKDKVEKINSEVFKSMAQELGLDLGSVQLQFVPIATKQSTPSTPFPSTQFELTITYACDQNNPNSSKTTIQTSWDQLLIKILSLKPIQDHFTFPGSSPETIDGGIVDTDPTIEAPNGALAFSSLAFCFAIVLLFVHW